MSCQERSGFLFAHACDREAAWPCTACGKTICVEHTRMTEAGYTCISCMRLQQEQAQQQQEKEPQQGEARQEPAEDDPYFYASGDRSTDYDADDYRAFESEPSSPEELAAEGDLSAS